MSQAPHRSWIAIYPTLHNLKQYSYQTGFLLVPNNNLSGWVLQGHPTFYSLCLKFSSPPYNSSLFLPIWDKELPVYEDPPLVVLLHGALISSFTENTVILNYFIICLLVCFLSSPMDPKIGPCYSTYHCKLVPGIVLATKLMLSKLNEWLNEWIKFS